jgi:DNA invertase Pin-like site-specific DNA recombinase
MPNFSGITNPYLTAPKGRPLLYSSNAKNPQKRLVYQEVVRMLETGIAIKQIAEKNAITRSTVYRIKKELAD